MPLYTGTNKKDSIYGGSENDTILGLEDDDYLEGDTGNDSIDGGSGNDYIDGEPGADTILGGDGDDSIYGGAGNDSISGGEGNDPDLDGGDGNDTITGGNGNDVIWGMSGNDYLDGNNGNDRIYGGFGDDTYIGGEGDDWLSDFGGNNYFEGGLGNDVIYGDIGNDNIIAGNGNDFLFGWDGNDTLNGGSGQDEMKGGIGNDTYYVDDVSDYIYDTGGIDTAYVSTSFVKLPSTIENVIYTDGAQALPYWISALLPDEAAGKKFTTFLGDSKSFGYFFPSTLPSYDTDTDHAKGYTTFSSAQKARTVIALSYISSVLDVSFTEKTTASGLNTLSFASNNQTGSGGYAQYPSSSFSGSDLFLNIADYNTTLADGTYGAYTLMHELGHALGLKHPFDEKDAAGNVEVPPYLQGSEDSTTWTYISYNYSSSEYYLRYSPLDIAALQYLYGPSKSARSGNDKYTISSSSANFIWDGAGTDLIDASAANQAATIYLTPGYWGYLGITKTSTITFAGQITVNFGSVIENLTGSAYADKLYGNEIANSIDGGLGNDLLEGWNGDDTLFGGIGNDSITGGVGNDSIDGGDGVDTLIVSGTSLNYTIRYNSATQKYSIEATTGTDGKDTFSNVEYISFSDKTVLLTSIDFKPPNSPIIGTEVSETFKTLTGDDSINGGGGIDTVVVSAGIDNYSVTKTATGYTLVDKNGADGTDSLINIERIQFKDKTLALDIGPGQNAGQVYRLYQAAFARTPDTPGVKYHLNDMEANGLALWNISSNFLASPEFSAKYGSNPTDTQYINALYKNVLNRTPAASEVAWYKDQFDSKKMDHQAALIGFSESPENVALVGVAISNGILLG